MHEILTVSEVAVWLQVHRSSIYRLLKSRAIPAFRVGTDWRFVKRDLELWLEEITVMGTKTCAQVARSARVRTQLD